MAIPPKFFATRFVYGGTTLDFDTPTTTVFPQDIPLTGSNTTYSGRRETLSNRIEYRLTLAWQAVPVATMHSLRLWFQNWAWMGKPTNITLDRANTCLGQLEYDAYNNVFSSAELLIASGEALPISRFLLEKPLYAVTLVFRQGVAA